MVKQLMLVLGWGLILISAFLGLVTYAYGLGGDDFIGAGTFLDIVIILGAMGLGLSLVEYANKK